MLGCHVIRTQHRCVTSGLRLAADFEPSSSGIQRTGNRILHTRLLIPPPPPKKNVSHSTATAIRREKAVNNLGVQTCRGSSVLMDNNVQAIQYISRKKKLLPRLSQGTLNRQDFSCLAFLCCRDLSSFLVDQYPLVGGRKT